MQSTQKVRVAMAAATPVMTNADAPSTIVQLAVYEEPVTAAVEPAAL